MLIEFKKIPSSGIHFEAHQDEVTFCGEAAKVSSFLVKCTGTLKGTLIHSCDRCAENFSLVLDEPVEVFACDGVYHDREGDDLLNVVEFFDESVHFDEILQSEIEAFKSDYHYCGHCETLKGE